MQTSLDKIKQEMTDKVVNELENIRYMTPKEKELYKATRKDAMYIFKTSTWIN